MSDRLHVTTVLARTVVHAAGVHRRPAATTQHIRRGKAGQPQPHTGTQGKAVVAAAGDGVEGGGEDGEPRVSVLSAAGVEAGKVGRGEPSI
jgi:hypothetical protein